MQRQNLELDAERKKWGLRQLIDENIRQKLFQKYPTEAKEIEERVDRDAVRLGTNEQIVIDKVETLETIGDDQ